MGHLPCSEGLGNLAKLHRAGDRALELSNFNEEGRESARHQLALMTAGHLKTTDDADE